MNDGAVHLLCVVPGSVVNASGCARCDAVQTAPPPTFNVPLGDRKVANFQDRCADRADFTERHPIYRLLERQPPVES